jgi:hypothetical protein
MLGMNGLYYTKTVLRTGKISFGPMKWYLGDRYRKYRRLGSHTFVSYYEDSTIEINCARFSIMSLMTILLPQPHQLNFKLWQPLLALCSQRASCFGSENPSHSEGRHDGLT